MTRRAAARAGRFFPLLLTAAAVAVAAALLTACGGSGGGATAEPAATATPATGTSEPAATPSATPSPAPYQTTLRLYFLREGKLGVAERQAPHTTMPATASLEALLAGPQGGEGDAGLSTAIPAGTKLLRLSISGGVAHADLSAGFAAEDSEEAAVQRTAQVVYTLTQFPTVRRVALTVGGKPFAATGVGGSPDDQMRRSDFTDLEPNIFVETPGVGAVLTSPFTLSGTAEVFEGTVLAKLEDSSGHKLADVIITASQGAPGRGTFAERVEFSATTTTGTLVVFDESMEDGSRQDEVKVPVTFGGE